MVQHGNNRLALRPILGAIRRQYGPLANFINRAAQGAGAAGAVAALTYGRKRAASGTPVGSKQKKKKRMNNNFNAVAGDIVKVIKIGKKKYASKGSNLIAKRIDIDNGVVTAAQNRCETVAIDLSTTTDFQNMFTAGFGPQINSYDGVDVESFDVGDQSAVNAASSLTGNKDYDLLFNDYIRFKNNGTESLNIQLRVVEYKTFQSNDPIVHLESSMVDYVSGATQTETNYQANPSFNLLNTPLNRKTGSGQLMKWTSKKFSRWLKPGQEIQIRIRHKLTRKARDNSNASEYYQGSKCLLVRIIGDIGTVLDVSNLPTASGYMTCGVGWVRRKGMSLYTTDLGTKRRVGGTITLSSGTLKNVNVDGEAVPQE